MAIRLEHQPSPGVVGMAAYAAGRGKARQRQRKQKLALYARQQEMRFGRQMQLERLGIQARLQQLGFEHAAGLQEERLGAGERMQQAGFDQAAGLQEGRLEHAAGLQERGFEERQGEADLEERRRAAEEARDRPDPMLRDYDLTPEDQRELDGLREKEREIAGSRDISDQDRKGMTDIIRARKKAIQDRSPKKPTLQERIDKRTAGLPEWQRKQPWNIDEDGNISLPSGFKMPDSPEAIQRKLEQDQAKAEYDESIHQWETADKDWLYKDAERGRYAKYLQGLEENEGLSRSEVMAKVDAEFGTLGPRPGRPAWSAPGGQQAGGQGGQRKAYDPVTKMITTPPNARSQQPGATYAPAPIPWNTPTGSHSSAATLPSGAVDRGDGTYMYMGVRYKFKTASSPGYDKPDQREIKITQEQYDQQMQDAHRPQTQAEIESIPAGESYIDPTSGKLMRRVD